MSSSQPPSVKAEPTTSETLQYQPIETGSDVPTSSETVQATNNSKKRTRDEPVDLFYRLKKRRRESRESLPPALIGRASSFLDQITKHLLSHAECLLENQKLVFHIPEPTPNEKATFVPGRSAGYDRCDELIAMWIIRKLKGQRIEATMKRDSVRTVNTARWIVELDTSQWDEKN